ncbi:uncharacterized protein EI97DRAFT_194587 [Westerdykella ornata]|uniref:Secreted protein n=1 Tax=Westerdykella ornata TaxID=318751 RepID=A0A6A6JBB2_WESOR|nr:uncharacterized protein EI97DRAFT_194587 [Westerdykella ornata]KAF2272916.1 hypothetical protein EI97DRAFT_194587 [Westerdykella ornata]
MLVPHFSVFVAQFLDTVSAFCCGFSSSSTSKTSFWLRPRIQHLDLLFVSDGSWTPGAGRHGSRVSFRERSPRFFHNFFSNTLPLWTHQDIFSTRTQGGLPRKGCGACMAGDGARRGGCFEGG